MDIPTGKRPAKEIRWLFLALALFLLQALPYLSHRWVTDESWYAGPGYSVANGNGMRDPAIGPNDLENHFDARPPGTALVIAAAFKVLGVSQTSARIGSIFAGLLVILLTYELSRDVLGTSGALIATFAVATDNLLVLTSRTARPEALTTMCIFAGLLAMKFYFKRRAAWYCFLAGILMALGTMFHITLLGYIVSFGLLAIYIDWKCRSFLLRGALLYTVGFAVGLVPFAVWILTAPQGKEGFRTEYLSRAVKTPLLIKLVHEGHRYSDFLGFNVLHGHGLDWLPIRLPIPLILLFASYLLWKRKREWLYLELLLLVPSLLWLVYTVNKSSRYLSILAPAFALVLGAAVASTKNDPRRKRGMLVLTMFVICAQGASNIFLLNGARKADYNKVETELRSVIPAGETVYGTITFWLAFHDRSFISYERTTPTMAADTYKAKYFIVGDRMMTIGDPEDSFYEGLRSQLQKVKSNGTLVGHFPDPYYGDLEVYRIR
jgi:4-amino-4-deoxy-L-arabinose transferase-like glycosyltransferase